MLNNSREVYKAEADVVREADEEASEFAAAATNADTGAFYLKPGDLVALRGHARGSKHIWEYMLTC